MRKFLVTGSLDGVKVTARVHHLNEFVNSAPNAAICVSSENENGEEEQTLVRKDQVKWQSIEPV